MTRWIFLSHFNLSGLGVIWNGLGEYDGLGEYLLGDGEYGLSETYDSANGESNRSDRFDLTDPAGLSSVIVSCPLPLHISHPTRVAMAIVHAGMTFAIVLIIGDMSLV